ncbi:hypothetical protein ACU4GD_29950 [Cupriavidus basilensis]
MVNKTTPAGAAAPRSSTQRPEGNHVPSRAKTPAGRDRGGG